jgi:hypothetical protein
MLIKFSYHRLKFSFAFTLCSMLMITKFQEENQIIPTKSIYIEISGLLNQRKSEIQKNIRNDLRV